jgi:lysine N6-hydroxylase
MHQKHQGFDLAGIGIGPSNLSTAALLDPIKEIGSIFFENKKEFQWFPGMLFPDALIQETVYFKDLATLVDPTNKYTFLSFLANKGRLYRFATAGFPRIRRAEFDQYYRWACASMDNLNFDTNVEEVRFRDGCFTIRHTKGTATASNLLLGTGRSPWAPDFARRHFCNTVIHATRYLNEDIDPKGKRVVVVGGGQSGAEIVSQLLTDRRRLPAEVCWISRRPNFLPLDDSPFTNEYFAPPYSDYFFRLPEAERRRQLREQVLASDGISLNVLENIYRSLYEIELLEGRGRVGKLYFDHTVTDLRQREDHWELDCRAGNEISRSLHADVVIFATGFEYTTPAFLEPIREMLETTKDGFVLQDDFSIRWTGPANNKIYVHNAARHLRGIADPNLSLIAWRSAKIINSLAGKTIYKLVEQSSAFDWQHLLPGDPVPSDLLIQYNITL